MDDQVGRLVDKAWAKFLQTPPERRLMIGIGGIPGSGKTTLSQIITREINTRHQAHTKAKGQPEAGPVAAFVPMDGFHLTRAQLSAMPDPATAHARRGAEFTFDGASFLKLVESLREPLPTTTTAKVGGGGGGGGGGGEGEQGPTATGDNKNGSEATTIATPSSSSSSSSSPHWPPGTIMAPSFDHAIKDPRPDDIPLLPTHRVLVLEGNYIALDRDPWRAAARLMDEVWFVDVSPAVARARLAARHLRAGIVATVEEGDRRAVENDLPNGEDIVAARVAVDEVVTSREDGGWVQE